MAGIAEFQEFQEPALRGLVDETVQDKVPSIGDRYLPNDNVYSNTFAYDLIKKSKNIGAMIGYGAEAPIVDRDAVANMAGEIAKMGLKHIATEEELLALHQARNDAEKQGMIDKLTVKGIDLVNAIQRRIDVIKMEALTKGTFDYNKNGVKAIVDFKVPAENKVALSAGSDWQAAGHDIIGDLLDWTQQYEDSNGEAPDAIYVSREVNALMLKNDNIVVEAGRPDGSTRVSQTELNTVLSGFGLPSVQVVGNRKVTVKDIYTGQDETIEFMPVNRVIMLAEGVGNFLLGPTVENNFQPGINLSAKDKDEPIESILKAVAAGFPAVEEPGLIFHADVYTP